MLISLDSDAEIQWKHFNATVRNQIRKAEQSGLTVQIGGKDLLADLYAMFA